MKTKQDGPNLVRNNNFADGLEQWTVDASPDTVHATEYAGRTAARFDRRVGGFIGQGTTGLLTAGHYVFAFSAAGEGSGPMNAIMMNVTVAYEDGGYESSRTNRFTATSDWGRTDLFGINLERNARSVDIGFFVDGPGPEAVAGHVYVTDVSLQRRD